MAGGLAMSWRRGDYTFETCLHWLFGSKPGADLHAQWQEIFDIERLTFVNPDEFLRIEDENGESLRLYSDVDRLEAELLRCAPQDAAAIRDLVKDLGDSAVPMDCSLLIIAAPASKVTSANPTIIRRSRAARVAGLAGSAATSTARWASGGSSICMTASR